MDEWYIGDSVRWGDGFMDAQNWGHGYNEDDDNQNSDYGYNNDYRRSAPQVLNTVKGNCVKSYREPYEKYMELARKEENDDEAVAYYKKAIDYGIDYLDALKRNSLTDNTFPSDKKDLLTAEDLEKCKQMYMRYKLKPTGIFLRSYPQKDDLEEIFKETGNKLELY